jgi:hypothetical protein
MAPAASFTLLQESTLPSLLQQGSQRFSTQKEDDRCICTIRLHQHPVCNTQEFHSTDSVTGDNAPSNIVFRLFSPEPADYFAVRTFICLILFSPF